MPGETTIITGLRRARRTAALARAAMSLAAVALAVTESRSWGVFAGFGIILATALVQLMLPRVRWLVVEESLAPVSAVLIVGLGPERATLDAILWMSCVACGVLARGGRQHWYGRAILLVSLALPIALHRGLTAGYAGLCLATIALLLTCGRVTRELRALHDRARHDADHDGLTGVLAQTALRETLDGIATALRVGAGAGAPAPEPSAGLVLVDLDNFGQVNKSAGHAAGDRLLVAIADRMRADSGEDGVVGRLGGDEFAVIVRGSDPRARADRLLDGVTATVAELAGVIGAAPVRASAGLALIPRDGGDAEALLRAGDVALRVAKRSGGGRLSAYDGEPLSERGPGGARDALERLIKGEGLSIVVQPIVAVPDRGVHAFEALARFDAGGSTSPLHWFSLADELGVRDRLELACVRAALQRYGERPPGTLLSINLSGSLLRDPRLHELLGQHGPLDGLILEVTENSLLEDTPGMRAAIARLRARSVRLAVDDMGAGYSGLRQIATVRPTYLKLDRSLVGGVDTDPDRGALVAAMVGYARQTDGHLVAEGVETAAELEALLGLGVRLVQGYLLARPGWPWPEVTPVSAVAPAAPARAASIASR